MGKVLSIALRKAQRFNVENRAQRVISQPKPKPAPKYESNLKDLEKILRDHPEIVEQASKKDGHLDSNLKQVFVLSTDSNTTREIDSLKPLPTNRSSVDDFEFGHQEPEPKNIPLHKCTLRQAIRFISDNQEKPDQWTAAKIAEDVKLNVEDTQDILSNFKVFAIHISPDKAKTLQFDPFSRQTSDFNKLLEISTRRNKEEKKEN